LEQTHISKTVENVPSITTTTTAAVADVGVDEEEDEDENSDDDDEPESFYGCIKCRTRLFEGSFVTRHALDTSKTVFKDGGEEGMCQSVVFVPCSGLADLSSRTSLAAIHTGDATVSVSSGFSTIECKGCGSKLGKFYSHEAHCACGAIVKGPIARLLTAKVCCC